MRDRVIVLAGHRRSLASIVAVSALARPGDSAVEVAGVICASEFSLRRLVRWHRRFGSQLPAKVMSGLGLGSSGSPFDRERRALLERLEETGVKERNLRKLCRTLSVPFEVVKNLNSPRATSIASRSGANRAVYTGGGILRKRLIDVFPGGVLNAHCGPLPHVRGMNAVEWSLYLGLRPTATVHYIDPGIDTGPVIGWAYVRVERGESLGLIRARTVLAGLDFMCSFLRGGSANERGLGENPPERGRQYYEMAEPLKRVVQGWIDRGVTPVVSPEETDPDDTRPAPLRGGVGSRS